jgi:endonuclease/exonuclease/phosphatase family metal-dependent hydrolase
MGSRYSIEQRWDAVVWMGDFNSRIEEFNYHRMDTERSIFEAIKLSDYEILSHHD